MEQPSETLKLFYKLRSEDFEKLPTLEQVNKFIAELDWAIINKEVDLALDYTSLLYVLLEKFLRDIGKKEHRKVIAYATAVIIYMGGICPICETKIIQERIKLSDIEKHIKDKEEYPLWASILKENGL